jgi:hypothetical protein
VVRILVTTSRMPFALDEIRKFGRAGCRVYASDTFRNAPGSHSRQIEEWLVTPSPRYETRAFLRAIRDFVRRHEIDLIVPSFEEVFYLARDPELLESPVRLFAPGFETLAMLHDKARFLAFAASEGLRVPSGRTVTDQDELRSATGDLDRFFARPVFSRGGVELFTNTGPLAGVVSLVDCHPSADSPWLVQEFVSGEDVCTFSIAHGGHVAAHSTYVHPKTIEHAGGIVFQSIHDPEALAIAQKIASATGYTGQFSLDLMRTDRGHVLIECNPRPTAGIFLMPGEMFVDAMLHPDLEQTKVVAPGERCKIVVALIRDMLQNWDQIPSGITELLERGRDVYADPTDILPALYQFLSYGHVFAYRRHFHLRGRRPKDLMASYFYDVCWNGEDIAA